MLTITVCRAAAAGEPSGRSRTARRCCSNWDVLAPSMVQWPLLCGRMASSFTSSPPGVSNSSTASIPVTPIPAAMASPRRCAARAVTWPRPGAGASTSRQIPSRCTVCTTGYTAAWPLGERATSTASSRSNATYSSTIRSIPWASTSAA
jgi:hypothetical protein